MTPLPQLDSSNSGDVSPLLTHAPPFDRNTRSLPEISNNWPFFFDFLLGCFTRPCIHFPVLSRMDVDIYVGIKQSMVINHRNHSLDHRDVYFSSSPPHRFHASGLCAIEVVRVSGSGRRGIVWSRVPKENEWLDLLVRTNDEFE